MRDWERLLGRARGYIEAQPVGAPRARYSRRAYERYARMGVEAFAGWRVDPERASHLVRSGVRMVALDRLAAAADALEAALRGEDRPGAARAAAEVEECLALLARVPRRVPSFRGGLSRDRGGAAATGEARP